MRRSFIAHTMRPDDVSVRHNTDTELGYYRGFEVGYKLGKRDGHLGKKSDPDPTRVKSFPYRAQLGLSELKEKK